MTKKGIIKMNKQTLWTVLLSMLAVIAIFGTAAAQETGAIIDLGESGIFSQEELEAAVDMILAEFDTFEGCEMHIISYTGDEESKDHLEIENTMAEKPFDECAHFDSAFRSPKEQYGAWEADTEYTWSWTLCRSDKGEWNLVNYGWIEPWLKSERYSMDELAAGMDAIYTEFDKMEGTAVRYMKYAGDEYSSGELEYINSLDRGTFDECAVYYVWFMSPKEAYGAWEPDMLYSWSFYLGRADKGDWQVVTFGN